ncbi:MAG: hypothetical protein ABI851_07325 [Saprospiraceae bacterium]
MKKLIFTLLTVFSFLITDSNAQGCVAIRNGGASCTHEFDVNDSQDSWKLNLSYRYFKSYKHFKGDEEQVERVELGSDVRNFTNFIDLAISKNITDKFSLTANLPFQAIRRSSLYEHDGKSRHETSATGLGDVLIMADYWLLPRINKLNFQVGLGVKLPTGVYNAQDYFYKNDTTYAFGPVDQSIQPGDGGTGLATQLNIQYAMTKNFGIYGNFYYLINPRDQNGVSTTRGGAVSATNLKYRTNVMSVPDQFLCRLGASYNISRLTVSAGARYEGIPSSDLIGSSTGFRRPGYIVGVEPGLSYMFKNFNFFAAVPFSLYRNRVQSVSDIQRTNDTGVFTQGDAAFSDYSLNVGFSYHFRTNKSM